MAFIGRQLARGGRQGRETTPISEVAPRASRLKKDKYLEAHRKKMLKEARRLGRRRALK